MARGDDRRDPLVIFRAPAAWKDRLYEHAAHQGVSVSVFCRTAIEAHLPAAPGNTPKAASAPPTGPRKARETRGGFQPAETGTPPPTRAPRKPPRPRATPDVCPHRVPSGSYCRKCAVTLET